MKKLIKSLIGGLVVLLASTAALASDDSCELNLDWKNASGHHIIMENMVWSLKRDTYWGWDQKGVEDHKFSSFTDGKTMVIENMKHEGASCDEFELSKVVVDVTCFSNYRTEWETVQFEIDWEPKGNLAELNVEQITCTQVTPEGDGAVTHLDFNWTESWFRDIDQARFFGMLSKYVTRYAHLEEVGYTSTNAMQLEGDIGGTEEQYLDPAEEFGHDDLVEKKGETSTGGMR